MTLAKIVSVGVAIFAMLFGSGNIVYPLSLGRDMGDQVWLAMAGFFITAVILPVIGLISALLCDGDYKKLFGRLGTVPGSIIIFLCMMLLGPFAIIPRCITLSYASVQWYIPSCTTIMFSVLSGLLIFATTYRPTGVIDILGKFLGPLKLALLLAIVGFGLMAWLPLPTVDIPPFHSFATGLVQGYWTLDLLATIFFSGLILTSLRKNDALKTPKALAVIGLKAGGVGALLLGIVYTGFCLVAAMHGPAVAQVEAAQLLTALAALLLGAHAGALANFTVAIACLTTAIALTTIFADYVQKELSCGKLSYLAALLITIVCSAVMANFGFARIMSLIAPLVLCIYPALIVLAIVNIAHVLWGWRYIKIPFWATLIATIALKVW
jgi:LIVCS family branched-chain amino acid:cation transporter